MANHAQNNVDSAQIIRDAAATIVAGNTLDDTDRLVAAGHAAETAVNDGNTALLNVIVLMGAGEFLAAIHLLADMAAQAQVSQPAAPASTFAKMANARANSTGNTGPVPTPPPASGTPGPTNTGRRPANR